MELSSRLPVLEKENPLIGLDLSTKREALLDNLEKKKALIDSKNKMNKSLKNSTILNNLNSDRTQASIQAQNIK